MKSRLRLALQIYKKKGLQELVNRIFSYVRNSLISKCLGNQPTDDAIDGRLSSENWIRVKENLCVDIQRFESNPIITSDMDDSIGENINGPSVIKVPEWVDDPLGEYYLYFAHHAGSSIRLAYADAIRGPWKIHSPGTLPIEDTRFNGHIASPDVHVDPEKQRLRMYFHGGFGPFEHSSGSMLQVTDVATSKDGIDFEVRGHTLGNSYFRVWEYQKKFYALANDGYLYSSTNPLKPFTRQQKMFPKNRHFAVRLLEEDLLQVFLTRRGDRPERLMTAVVVLSEPDGEWAPHPHPPYTVLWPEEEYEGGNRSLSTSEDGKASEPSRSLRDPAVFRDGKHSYLFYTVEGERAIAGAELRDTSL